MRIYDISPRLHQRTAVWPGDTPFSRRVSLSLEKGDAVTLSDIRLSLHTGTHADAPSHFLLNAPAIDELDLEAYWGPARVVTVPGQGPIEPEHLKDKLIENTPARLLLRAHPDFNPDRFPADIRPLPAETARLIGSLGIKLLGVDAPSVDPLQSKALTAHKLLDEGGTRILENLVLEGVPDGWYELSALPLKVEGGDAAPVRAALRELGETDS